MTEDERLALKRRLRHDLVAYAARCLTIRAKDGSLVRLDFNKAQKHIHKRLEDQKLHTGKVRALILKGRQQGCCYSPDMRVLTADYRWVRVGDLNLGERLIAIAEDYGEINGAGRRQERRIRTAVVEAKVALRREAFEVVLNSGVKLIVTGEHRHLCQRRGGDDAMWRAVNKMRVGDFIRTLCNPPDDGEPNYDDGWFGGLLDGEGSFGASPQVRIALSQVPGPVLEKAKSYLTSHGIQFYELIDTRSSGASSKFGDKEVHCLRIDRCSDIIRLLTLTRPTRFAGRELFIGKKLPKTCPGFNAWAEVVSITPVGERDVVDIQTSEKTFICEGIVSHNSTLIGARFYHAVTHSTGKRVFILTHEDAATANLFEMVQRFHDHVPLQLRPETGAANAKELAFSALDSGYKVGTAGTKGVGRSSTIQYFHASECAFWPHAETHEAGILQAVPDEAGTEVILESTANGLGNMFHRRWRDAELGVGDYQAIFVPWFWQEEYVRAPGPRFVLDVEEAEYAEAYGLSDAQIAWRRAKIIELKSPVLFKQEYPASAAEAFQMSGHDSYIKPELVARARHATVEPHGPLVIGYDPAWHGDDRSSMAWRKGRSVYRIESKHNIDTMQGAGWAKQVIDRDRPKRMFVDVGGIGAGIYDRLCEMGYDDVVMAVNFGSSPLEPQPEDRNGVQRGGPRNRRAEMWMWLKDWLEDPAGVSIPDSDSLQADLCGPGYKWDSNTRLLLESKDDMRRREVRSPDEGDAVALTFAEPVAPEAKYEAPVREWVV